MTPFADLFAIAADRHGGAAALAAKLPDPVPAETLADLPEARWLSALTKAVFQAGFNWSVISAKWDGFEHAFDGFDVDRAAMMSDDDLDRHLANAGIVRNAPKILSVRDNAIFLQSLRPEGGAGTVLGGWPQDDFVGLLDLLKRRGTRLGPATAQYALRSIGRDGFILSADVTRRLIVEGVVDKQPTSKSAMRAVQEAFSTWHAESGRPLMQISRVLGMSL